MKVNYTGKSAELSSQHRKKVEARFAKLGKLLDGRGEREAHVVLGTERRQQKAEVTATFYGRAMVGVGLGPDLLTALTTAVDKLEKQALKLRSKWRDTKRTAKAKEAAVKTVEVAEVVEPEPAVAPRSATESRVRRVTSHKRRKPMTVDEAILEMDGGRNYVVYRDAQTDKVSVLVKRSDGGFDLVES